MNKRILLAVLMLGIFSTASKCNFALFGSPTQTNEGDTSGAYATPTPTPTPTPIKVDSSCEAGCDVYSVIIDEGDSTIAIGASKEFNLTPSTLVNICDELGKPTSKTKIIKTSAECDEPRAGMVGWVASSNAVQLSKDGFKVVVKRVASGVVTLTGSLEGKSFSREIR